MKKTLLIVSVFITVLWTPVFAYETEQFRAARTAQDVIDRAVRVGDEQIIPRDALKSATLGRAVFVHHPATLERVYGVVPVLSSGGSVIGLIGVDPDGATMQWCTFKPRHGRFPMVSGAEAGSAVNLRLRDLGRREALEAPVLVQGAVGSRSSCR